MFQHKAVLTNRPVNLQLQEEILVLEDQARDSKLKQKQAEDTLKMETERQTELSSKYDGYCCHVYYEII